MSTTNFECGCSITYSMFGEREILDITCCMTHVQRPEIQEILQQLTEIIYQFPIKKDEALS